MTQQIVIEGDLVKIVTTEVRSIIALSDFLPKIEKRTPIYTPELPTNTRAVWWDPTDLQHQKLALLIEREPQIINMTMSNVAPRHLSIPWTRFYIYAETSNPNDPATWQLADQRIFWAKVRYTKHDAKDMRFAMLPNVYPDGRICFGSTGVQANQSLANRIDQIVNEFYVSTFNRDLTIHYPRGWTSFNLWETMTRNHPLDWANWTSDFAPTNRYIASWDEQNARHFANGNMRMEPVIANDGIPPLPIGATFGRVGEWVNSLDNNGRARLEIAINEARATNAAAFIPTEITEDAPNEETI